jgi:hypothetical protein
MPALARTTQPGFNRCPDLHRLIHSKTSKTATTSRSRIRKPTVFAIHRLADTPPLQPLRPNPHSARGTAIRSPSRFRPLAAFGRRPRSMSHRPQRPASETLNTSGSVGPLPCCRWTGSHPVQIPPTGARRLQSRRPTFWVSLIIVGRVCRWLSSLAALLGPWQPAPLPKPGRSARRPATARPLFGGDTEPLRVAAVRGWRGILSGRHRPSGTTFDRIAGNDGLECSAHRASAAVLPAKVRRSPLTGSRGVPAGAGVGILAG